MNAEFATDSEASMRRMLRFIVDGIVQARHTLMRREILFRKCFTIASVVVPLLGAAGLIGTKVEPLREYHGWALATAIASLLIIIVMELYRVFGIEETALQLLAANKAFSLIETETRHALEVENPLPLLEKIREKARQLEMTFHEFLPTVDEVEAAALVETMLAKYRPDGGWKLPVSQQKPKRK